MVFRCGPVSPMADSYKYGNGISISIKGVIFFTILTNINFQYSAA